MLRIFPAAFLPLCSFFFKMCVVRFLKNVIMFHGAGSPTENSTNFSFFSAEVPTLCLLLCPFLTVQQTAQLAYTVSLIILFAHLTFGYIPPAVTALRAGSGLHSCQLIMNSAEILVTKSPLRGHGGCEIKQRIEQSWWEGGMTRAAEDALIQHFPSTGWVLIPAGSPGYR